MQSKSKATKWQAKEREQRGHKKLAKQRRKSKGTAHGPRPTRNQHEVAKRLLAGEVAMVGGTGWSFVEPFLAFLGEVGFFEILRLRIPAKAITCSGSKRSPVPGLRSHEVDTDDRNLERSDAG